MLQNVNPYFPKIKLLYDSNPTTENNSIMAKVRLNYRRQDPHCTIELIAC